MLPDDHDPPPPAAPLRDALASLGLPPGLVVPAVETSRRCDSRLWLLDNSSRMSIRDGRVAVVARAGGGDRRAGRDPLAKAREGGAFGAGGGIERVDGVSRWKELQECVAFHSRIAGRCWIPTRFWMVNDPAKASATWKTFPELQARSRRFGICLTDKENVGK